MLCGSFVLTRTGMYSLMLQVGFPNREVCIRKESEREQAQGRNDAGKQSRHERWTERCEHLLFICILSCVIPRPREAMQRLCSKSRRTKCRNTSRSASASAWRNREGMPVLLTSAPRPRPRRYREISASNTSSAPSTVNSCSKRARNCSTKYLQQRKISLLACVFSFSC